MTTNSCDYIHVVMATTRGNGVQMTTPARGVEGRGSRRVGDGCLIGLWGLCVITMGVVIGCVEGFNVDVTSARVRQGPDGSYFGFSMTFHTNKQGHWLLVGDPKASDEFQRLLNTSGALYRCNLLTKTACEQVAVDTTGNQNVTKFITTGSGVTVRFRYKDYKHNQWFGVSVQAHQHGKGAVVACAHRWANIPNIYLELMNGACYIMNGDMTLANTERILPLAYRQPQVKTRPRVYRYAFAQVGMVAHFTQDGQKLILGAPGMEDWTGGVVEVANGVDTPIIPDKYHVETYSYLGYSVSSGNFYGRHVTSNVAGAPRSHLTGRVVIYDTPFHVKEILSGRQMGEYFGAAVCVVDINHDGLDDLLVGAPLYKSNVYEEGRVALYTMRKTYVFYYEFDLEGSRAAGSRFGSAIASADLTLDGNPDVLVGAPYEDEGHGAVYIYNGYHSGLHQVMSQRISARELNTGLRGFGYALTTPTPKPGQDYPDVAIGAYASNMVVVLLVRPVVKISLVTKIHPERINHRVVNCQLTNLTYSPRSCLMLNLTFQYTGVGLPPTAAFIITVHADVTRDSGDHPLPIRGGFRNETHKHYGITTRALPMFSTNISALAPNTKWEDGFVFVLNKNVVDVITPVTFSLEVTMVTPTITSAGYLQPIVDLYSQRNLTLVVPFDKKCGEENECKAKLQLTALVRWPSPDINYVILGQKEPINIELHINNVGENAYMTSLILLHSPDLQFAGTRRIGEYPGMSCTPHASPEVIEEYNGKAVLMCDVGNPVAANSMHRLIVWFERPTIYHWKSQYSDRVIFKVMVRTRSQEDYIRDNDVTLSLPVKVSADINLSGAPYPEQHLYKMSSPNTTSRHNTSSQSAAPEVYHIYSLRNNGPGIFLGAFVEVMVPVRDKAGNQLLDFHVVIKDDNSVLEDTTEIPAHRKRRDEPDVRYSFANASVPSKMGTEALSGTSPNTPLDVTCETVQCDLRRFMIAPIEAGDSITVRIYMTLDLANLIQLQDDGMVQVMTRVVVVAMFPYLGVKLADLQVATLLTSRQAVLGHGIVPLWVVATSVGIGVCCLLIVIVVLNKLGFFARARREELVKLIGQNEDNEQHETRMLHHEGENRPEASDWRNYDPWQPQNAESSVLIWHANGSVSHNSREEYLASTRGSSSSGMYDRNRNEKYGRGEQLQPNGFCPSHVNLPSTSGSGGSGERGRHIRPRSTGSTDDEVFCDVSVHRSFVDIPDYLVIRPAEDSDEEDLLDAQIPHINNNNNNSRR